jgi:hypothetical protein
MDEYLQTLNGHHFKDSANSVQITSDNLKFVYIIYIIGRNVI